MQSLLIEMLAERPLRFADQSATGWDYFDYRPGQPNLYMLMRFKQQLMHRYGLEHGFSIYRQTIRRQADAKLERKRLESHHAYSRSSARIFEEIFPAGEKITIPPPVVIGQGNHRTLHGVSRSFYVSCIDDAVVRGRSSIVEADDVALADFQDDELARIDDEVEFDSYVFHRDGDNVHTIIDARPAIVIDEAFSLLGAKTDFFGDWLCESITRYVGATLADTFPNVPILIDAWLPPTHRQALDIMLPVETQIIEVPTFQAVRVKRLWSTSSISYMPFHQVLNDRFRWEYCVSSPCAGIKIGDEMIRRLESCIDKDVGPSKVFLARRPTKHRKMLNCAEIEQVAVENGFVLVYPEDLNFKQQAKLLYDARYVIGPEGSAFFLSYFLRRGAKVCILNHEETDGLVLYNNGMDLVDIDLTIISGPKASMIKGRSIDADYSIDRELFAGFLKTWLS